MIHIMLKEFPGGKFGTSEASEEPLSMEETITKLKKTGRIKKEYRPINKPD